MSTRSRNTLVLDAFRVRVVGSAMDEVEAVRAWMCPPAHLDDDVETPDWTLLLEDTDLRPPAPARSAMFGIKGWPRLSVAEGDGDRIDVVGQYRRDDPWVYISVDRQARRTAVSVPRGLDGPLRWAAWLVRVFFGTRMVATGWRLLHSSCVALRGKAVVIGGAAGVGKSSLAHLGCAQLGAEFLSDDLTLVARVGRAATAVGWPTRVCPPSDLMTTWPGATRETRAIGPDWRRDRWVLGPAEHAAATGFRRGGQAPVAAVVLLEREPTATGVDAIAAEADQAAFMTDSFGLMGEPDMARRTEPDVALSTLFAEVPVLRITADRPAIALAPTVWNRLRQVVSIGEVA